MSSGARANRLDRDVDPQRDHVLGGDAWQVTLVEYGSYLCTYCHAAHEVVGQLRDRFGERLRYVYRHLPLTDRDEARRAAILAEYAATRTGDFWRMHDVLMQRGPHFAEGELDAIAGELGVPPREQWDEQDARAAAGRVRDDALSGIRSGARVTPTFFINGRRYEGAWDETALSEAMLRSLGHRIHTASVDFARWAPSTGLLLLLMTVIAVVVSNTPLGSTFLAFWETPAGVTLGAREFGLTLVDWVNHGLLTIFFLVVGLEIKRELTVGRLATPRAAALPLVAALGGMVVPAALFLLVAPEAYRHAWGMTIATDTAFAIALLVLLGDRVPVELRVFFTAAVIADDLVAILVVALFYTGAIHVSWLIASAALTAALVLLNRAQVYRAMPYAVLGVGLWLALHESGLHATLAGVILAVVTPTRPPGNLPALLAQAQAIIDAETRFAGDAVMRHGPSEPARRELDALHDRIESPANKLHRGVEPWSSYLVLPLFALANAGVVWSADVLAGRGRLVLATVAALVAGKLAGILLGARAAVQLGIATKPEAYTWRQVAGAGALAGIGFTMSLFIAGEALEGADFATAKLAIFTASLVAGLLGTMILWRRSAPEERRSSSVEGRERRSRIEQGTPIETNVEPAGVT
ncbi:MAG TPA: Na+/H+ antiporter NhaA [Gemmatimonadaceae bacterium]|nr:Na+/H+ antiporter NhaA [Gemmatimonadaceae bacterium]